MKVYPDANIYVTYLMGQKGEAKVDKFFKQGIACRFTLVASNTMFAEAAQRCENQGIMLLQKNIDDFKKAGKIEIVERTPEETRQAVEMALGNNFGRNDMAHCILAEKYADVFVTNDLRLAKFASKTQKAMELDEFLNVRI